MVHGAVNGNHIGKLQLSRINIDSTAIFDRHPGVGHQEAARESYYSGIAAAEPDQPRMASSDAA